MNGLRISPARTGPYPLGCDSQEAEKLRPFYEEIESSDGIGAAVPCHWKTFNHAPVFIQGRARSPLAHPPLGEALECVPVEG